MKSLILLMLIVASIALTGCSESVFSDSPTASSKSGVSGELENELPDEVIPPELDDEKKKVCWHHDKEKWEWRIPVCHLPAGDEEKGKTLYLPLPAVVAHLLHGDIKGKCDDYDEDSDSESSDDDSGSSDDDSNSSDDDSNSDDDSDSDDNEKHMGYDKHDDCDEHDLEHGDHGDEAEQS